MNWRLYARSAQASRLCPNTKVYVAAPNVEIFIRHAQGQIPKLQRRPVLALKKEKKRKMEKKKVWEEGRKMAGQP